MSKWHKSLCTNEVTTCGRSAAEACQAVFPAIFWLNSHWSIMGILLEVGLYFPENQSTRGMKMTDEQLKGQRGAGENN